MEDIYTFLTLAGTVVSDVCPGFHGQFRFPYFHALLSAQDGHL